MAPREKKMSMVNLKDFCKIEGKRSVFSVGFQVEVGPFKVDVADTESLQTRSVCARHGGPCLLGGSGGMPLHKILTCYTLRDAFSCILKH